ncbi:hypothetical protein D9M68_983910 [compost metagenome]
MLSGFFGWRACADLAGGHPGHHRPGGHVARDHGPRANKRALANGDAGKDGGIAPYGSIAAHDGG